MFRLHFSKLFMIKQIMNKTCIDCHEDKPLDSFYKQKGHLHDVMVYCKTCFNQRCMQRWSNLKIKAVEYLGSGCTDCDLTLNNTIPAVFEFHHLNPSTKDCSWTKLRLRSWDKITQELDKCICLCANCHRIREWSRMDSNHQPTL